MVRKDPTEFRKRFAQWKLGIKPYDAGRPVELPEVVVTPDYEYNLFLNTLPDYQKDFTADKYDTHRFWLLNDKPENFNQAIDRGMYELQSDGYHGRSIMEDGNGDYEFMKSKNHPSLDKELNWYNSKEGKWFKDQYDLVDDLDRPGFYKYVRKYDDGKPD